MGCTPMITELHPHNMDEKGCQVVAQEHYGLLGRAKMAALTSKIELQNQRAHKPEGTHHPRHHFAGAPALHVHAPLSCTEKTRWRQEDVALGG